MRRRTISARNSEAPLSFFLGAELDLVVFLFSAAALAGLISDPSFLASRAGVTGCRRGSGSRGTVADRENQRCWSGFAGVFSAAALAGLLCDPPFLAYRGGAVSYTHLTLPTKA